MLRHRLSVLALALSAIATAAAGAGDHCRDVSHLSEAYTVCTFDPALEAIRIYGVPDGSTRPATYGALRDRLRENREAMIFGMNAGMFHPDYSPVGLLVENGKERNPLNRADGEGNFFLKPNGVFFIGHGTAGVMETGAYAAAKPAATYATQSGPMLVIDGAIHPRFLPLSDSLYIRNGVGIQPDGRVAFAISRRPVRFHDFATLFRDRLECRNALYLDGSVSSLYTPEVRRTDRFAQMGTVVMVVGALPY